MITTTNLTKLYGKHEALIDVSLQIEQGKVFGYIGPNGAGKSTTMLILSTLLAPTRGSAYVGGYDVMKNPKAVRQMIGYMPDFFGVYDNLKTTEYLNFYAGAYQIPSQKRTGLIADLLELVNLSNKADSYVDALSRGMKQRLGLARCLIHNPDVLILDEPASGLDPRARIEMREILKELKRMKKTIMISSHILPELAELCDEIGVIEKGKMIAYGDVQEMSLGQKGITVLKLKLLSAHVVEKSSAQNDPNQQGKTAEKELIKAFPGVHQVDDKQDHYRILFAGTELDQANFLKYLLDKGLVVIHFGVEQENLEDVFLSITEGVGN